MAVAAQVEQDRAGGAFLLAAQRFVDRTLDGVVGLRRRHDALGAGEGDAGLEALELVVGARLDQPELLQVTHQRCHAVITQAARVESGRDERGPQGVHLHQRRQVRRVAEVVGVRPSCERRAGGRLHGDDAYPALIT